MRYALIVTCCISFITPAFAQNQSSEAAKAMVGNWEFSNASRDKRCTITFKAEAGAAGMKVEFDKGCSSLFPFVTEISGWSIAQHDFLRLLNAKSAPVLEFSEVESRMFEAPRPGEGILFIQSADEVKIPKRVQDMAGNWAVMRRAGNPICTITLTSTAVGQDFALNLQPGCDTFVANFSPISWQMDRSDLLLKNIRNQTWRFEGIDNDTWQRVPESNDPVSLVRQ